MPAARARRDGLAPVVTFMAVLVSATGRGRGAARGGPTSWSRRRHDAQPAPRWPGAGRSPLTRSAADGFRGDMGRRHRVGSAALTAAAAGATYLLVVRPRLLRWGATDAEVRADFPGQHIVPGGARA